ncbi:MAG TPA: outer membrane beta-barrel domain-containing protein [Fredinandcohnia sp.]|nr:outer membrane beta-barrel domain-containing protein [Fredinandcohnia sp.]
MRIAVAIAILGWLVAVPVGAQEFGLDLRDEEEDEASSGERDGPREGTPPRAEEGPYSAEELRRRLQGEVPATVTYREDVAVVDKVKAVQRKHFLKRQRLELMPTFAISLNDPFYTKVGGGLVATYHLADSLGVAAHYTQFGIVQTDHVRIAKRELRSLLLSSKLNWNAGLDLVWTPIYGKLAWFNSIVHYDFFLLTGLGAAHSQTSGAPVDDGLHPAVDVGLGQRFAFSDWMAVDFWVKGLLYADRPQDRQISEIQKVLTLNVGLSFWLPTSFSYRGR